MGRGSVGKLCRVVYSSPLYISPDPFNSDWNIRVNPGDLVLCIGNPPPLSGEFKKVLTTCGNVGWVGILEEL